MHVAVGLRNGYIHRHSVSWTSSSGGQLIIPGRMSDAVANLAATMQHLDNPCAVGSRRELKGIQGRMTVI